MSKMGQKLEDGLDANKYELYTLFPKLLHFVESYGQDRHFASDPSNCEHCILIIMAKQVLAKIDG